ncbi:hypothetical protein JCM3770_006677 [Rhodotorula araucariae]
MDPHPAPHHHPPTPSPALVALPLAPARPLLPAYTDPALAFSPYPPRPRLKRSHVSEDPPLAPSVQSLDYPPAVVCQPAPGRDSSWGTHLRGRSAGSSLDPIKEWPAAEDGLGLHFGPGAPRPPATSRDDDSAPRATKRLRVAPDHEAFERLTLAGAAGSNTPVAPSQFASLPVAPAPSSRPFTPGPRPTAPPLPVAPLPAAFPPPLALAPGSSPTSRTVSLPAAPPTSPVTASPTLALAPAPPVGTGGLPTVPWAQSAFFRPPPQSPRLADADEQSPPTEEVMMLPATGSIDLSPHRVYVASLDDDDDEEDDVSGGGGDAPVAINPLAVRAATTAGGADLPAALVARLRREAERAHRGEVVLYRPPASFHDLGAGEDEGGGASGGGSARGRALREQREQREHSWAEFERAREREEALHDADIQADAAAGTDGDGMDVDMEL